MHILFISMSPVARDEFERQMKVVQPEQPLLLLDETALSRLPGLDHELTILDCRNDPAFHEHALELLRQRADHPPHIVAGILNNTEVAKAWAVKAGIHHVIVSPFTLLDLHIQLLGLGELLQLRRAALDNEDETSRLRKLAYTDYLTGLPNRLFLEERLQETIAGNGHDRSFAFQIIDLNGFKQVNDRFGHQIGDRLLKQVSERVARISRRLDIVARLGGDEIGVLQTGALSRDDCLALARRLLAAFEPPFEIDGHSIAITASIGSALFPADAVDLSSLMRSADDAMYEAKTGNNGAFVTAADGHARRHSSKR